jgi:uridine phosphorylase
MAAPLPPASPPAAVVAVATAELTAAGHCWLVTVGTHGMFVKQSSWGCLLTAATAAGVSDASRLHAQFGLSEAHAHMHVIIELTERKFRAAWLSMAHLLMVGRPAFWNESIWQPCSCWISKITLLM